MSYSIKTPNDRINNAVEKFETIIKSEIIIDSRSTTNHIFAQFLHDSGRFLDGEVWGNFHFIRSPLDLTDVTGEFTRSTVSYQGQLWFEEIYTQGCDIGKLISTESYPYHLSLLSGDDYFEGSDIISKQDNGRGLGGNDIFIGNKGNDYFDGGLGIDTMCFSGSSEQYLVKVNQKILSKSIVGLSTVGLVVADLVSERNGTDEGIDVERLSFSDMNVAFDFEGAAGQSYRIYTAAFDRTPDTTGLGYWIAQMDKGMDVVEVAARFIDSAEFRQLYGSNVSNAAFITNVYKNVLDRNPDEVGLAWWVNEMKTNPSKTWQKVLADFSESAENKVNVASLIANGIAYDPWE
jgi:Ca2+-binding RTX toxin-like protein